MRYTNQRLAILEFLKGNKDHPTIDEVYAYVKERLPAVSKATIYQNLKSLSDNGLVKEMIVDGKLRFEPNTHPHSHLICRRCGKIIDIEDNKLIDNILHLTRNMKPESIIIYGLCKECGGR